MQSKSIAYRIDLRQPDEIVAAARSLLSAEERARADRFIVEPPRVQFTLCRAALRVLLAERLACQAQQVRFEYTALGKPRLSSTARTCSIHFNLSHSADFGVIAISDQPIGVDIEKLQPRINAKSLMNQVLSDDEQSDWIKLPPSQHAQQIIRLWVCKEALLKAMGLGIAECLRQISFALPIDTAERFQPRRIDPAMQLHLDESANCQCNPWMVAENWAATSLNVDSNYFCVVMQHALADMVQSAEFEMRF